VTIKQACARFLEHCEGRHRRDERMTRKMLAVYKGHVTNHILHAEYGIGERKLSQFTARSVGVFRDALRGAGVTVPTTRKILATLHSILEHAISEDWVATNAAHGVKVIGPRGEGSEKIEPPSKDGIRAVIDAAREDLRLMLVFAASTGARAGEQWAVRWRDVSFDRGELDISRRVDAYGDEGAPKSVAGVRTVPLSAHLVSMLKAWKLKSKFSGLDDLIFPNRHGRHLGHDNLIKRQFLPLLDELKTVKRFNWHGLRHFAVSCWIEASTQDGADLRRPCVATGHNGQIWPSIPERRSQEGDGPNCQRAIQLIRERVANKRLLHVPSVRHGRAGTGRHGMVRD
jgi:integrase